MWFAHIPNRNITWSAQFKTSFNYNTIFVLCVSVKCLSMVCFNRYDLELMGNTQRWKTYHLVYLKYKTQTIYFNNTEKYEIFITLKFDLNN